MLIPVSDISPELKEKQWSQAAKTWTSRMYVNGRSNIFHPPNAHFCIGKYSPFPKGQRFIKSISLNPGNTERVNWRQNPTRCPKGVAKITAAHITAANLTALLRSHRQLVLFYSINTWSGSEIQFQNLKATADPLGDLYTHQHKEAIRQ